VVAVSATAAIENERIEELGLERRPEMKQKDIFRLTRLEVARMREEVRKPAFALAPS
jgi:hypothetical protein